MSLSPEQLNTAIEHYEEHKNLVAEFGSIAERKSYLQHEYALRKRRIATFLSPFALEEASRRLIDRSYFTNWAYDQNIAKATEHYTANPEAYQEQALACAQAEGVQINFGTDVARN